MGLWALPQVMSGAWAEFEQGDLTRPIWSGSWLGTDDEVPVLANILLQTTGQTTLVLSDLPGPEGGILLSSLVPLASSALVEAVGASIVDLPSRPQRKVVPDPARLERPRTGGRAVPGLGRGLR